VTGLYVERAAPADLMALLEVERASYSHPWTRRNFEGELAAVERGMLLVLREGGGQGAPDRGLRAYCAFQVVAGEMHILNLTVAGAERRRGRGRFLLRLALDLAAARGASAAFLEVRAGNAPALALYRAVGFVEAGRRKEYYRRPTEDAVLLRRGLGPGAPEDS
jgi:ribosomal-protein-alanine N-acetyltransferase